MHRYLARFAGHASSAVALGIGLLLVATLPAAAVDLATAIRQALAADARIPAGQLEVEAAQGGVIQAGKRPNPELAVEVEDFGGTGDYQGFNKATLTVSLQQKLERGEKRSARVAVALGKEDVANSEIAIAMREIIAQTKIDYIQVLGAQQRLELLSGAAKRFEDLVPLLRRRLEAGAGLPADVSRGEVAAGKVRVGIDKARAELTAARRQLASNWSSQLREGERVEGRLRHNGHHIPPIQTFFNGLDDHPLIRAWNAVYAQRDGELRLQRATAIPDLTASAGVKRIYETDDTAIRIGGSIPLPVFDRNEGAIQEADRRLAKVEFERESARRQLKRRVIDAYGELESACVEARRLVETVIPLARRATENVQSSFDQGRLTVKDLLDAARDQYDVEVQQLDADIKCHAGAAKLETLASRQPFRHGWEAVTRRSVNE